MDPGDCLNILEQRPNWARVTTNIAWFFGRSENVDTTKMITTLQNGLDRLVMSFPWIAGQVVNEGFDTENNNSGVYRIVPRNVKPEIVVRDYRAALSFPEFNELRRVGFATKWLDEDTFSPRPTLALKPGEVNPVLLVQANIIANGFVVVFSGNHSAMDMPGQAQVIRWFAKACRGEAFDKEELEIGNMPRRDLVPLLDSTYQPGDELLQQTVPAPTIAAPANQPKDEIKLRWATFSFPSASVATLKATATATRTSLFVSTDDVLSAFLWQAIARARLHRLKADDTSTVGRAMNVRRALDIPSKYPGLAQNTMFRTCPLRELDELPLGVIASALRDAITSSSPSVSHYTRSLATALSRSTNKGRFRIAARLDMAKDVLLTSHASMGGYDLDFSLNLGVPEAVRRTPLVEFEGLLILLPSTPSGDVAVTTCLREEDLERLEADGLMLKYAQFLG